ncbi:MAG: SDR family NAD(P)-dependent oxidoreductase [Bacillota bacterium]
MQADQRTVLITGATSGIGLQTAKILAQKGFAVMGVGRSQERIDAALKYLDNSKACYFLADLASQQQIRRLAAEVREHLNGRGLDVLINNAGTFYSYYALSDEGVEMQFAVNVAAPYLLSHLLYEDLKKVQGRIIMLSSGSHYKTAVHWNDIQLSQHYRQLQAYKQTKLFAVHLAREFNKRFNGVRAFAADPGLVNTEMGLKYTKGVARVIWKYRKRLGVQTQEGARTPVYLATEKDLGEDIYWKDGKPKAPARNAMRNDFSQRIWEYCERICAIDSNRVIEEGEHCGTE